MYRLATIRRGYPLALAREYTASTFSDLEDALAALAALGPYVFTSGYAGVFNPRHPAASEYTLVAVSTSDSSLVVVKSTN